MKKKLLDIHARIKTEISLANNDLQVNRLTALASDLHAIASDPKIAAIDPETGAVEKLSLVDTSKPGTTK
jgi:hypothetical protein